GSGAGCRQLVPTAGPEAHRLAALVRALPAAERARVEERFAEAVAALATRGLLERLRRVAAIEDPAERQRFGLDYFAQGIPCPFLVAESCSIHPERPLSCREDLGPSPAERCARPEAGTIDKVARPAGLSRALSRRSGEGEPSPPRWLPLVLALEWAAANPEDDPPAARPGPELLMAIVSRAVP